MIKKIFLYVVIFAITAVAVIYFFGSSALNKGIKTGVEKFGPEVTQTPVRLDAVDLSILSGNGTLTGLYVGNPDGYNSEHIFALGQIDIDIDTSSIFSDQIIINHIHIQKPEISYEKTLISSNIKALLQNIEAFAGAAEAAESTPAAESEDGSSAADGSSKQVIIRELIIEDGTIFVGLMGAGTTIPLPRIQMKDIGETGNQKSMAEVLDLIVTEVLKSIGPAIANGGNVLGQEGKHALKEGEDALQKATDSIKGLFGQ